MTTTGRTVRRARPAVPRAAALLGAALALAAFGAPRSADAQHHGQRRGRRRGHRTVRAASPQADMVFAAPAEPPPAPSASGATPPAGTATTANAAAPAASANERRPAAIDAVVGIRAFRRNLSWHQDLFREFRPYDVDAAPAVFVAAEWYPGAHFTSSFLANLGLVVAGEHAFGLSSRDSANRAFNTTAAGYSGGLRVRVPIGLSEVGGVLGYGVQIFTVDVPRTPGDTGIPGVTYQYLRFGASGRIGLGERFAVLLSASYLHVLTAGELTTVFFPRMTGGAVEGSVGLSVALIAGLELRAAFEARRYFFAMNPRPGDTYVVGGALDQYFSGSLGLAFRR